MAKQPSESVPERTTPVPEPVLPKCKLLEKMRASPAGDWTINDVETLCRQLEMKAKPPRSGGSHYKVTCNQSDIILMIPAAKPVKSPYIKLLVKMADAHRRAASGA